MLFTYHPALSQELTLGIKIADSTTLKQNNIEINYTQKHNNIKSLQQEVKTFLSKLEEHGFYSHKIDSLSQTNNIYHYYISTNNKINTIILNSSQPNINQYFHNIKFPILTTPENLTTQLNNLTKVLDQKGYLFTKVTLTNLYTSKDSLTTTIKTTPVEKRKIDTILIKGYTNFPKSFLSYYARLKKGNTLSIEETKTKTELINQLTFASIQKNSEILFTKDTTKLYLYINKTTSNYFDGYLGFSTNEETNKLTFNGTVNIQLTNNLNTGEEIKIYWKNTGESQSTFTASGNFPYLFNTPISLNTSLNILKQDSTYATTTTKLNPSYTIKTNNHLGGVYQQIKSTNTLSDSNTQTLADYTTTLYGLSYTYSENPTLNPLTQTKQLSLITSTGYRKTNNTTTPQQTIEFNTYHQFNITENSKLFTQNNTQTLLSKNYLENEQYLLGGINSIRGFDENSISANFYTVTNIEYRSLLSKNLYIHSITDFCYFENKKTSTKNHLFGLGLGIGIIKKTSIFKLNYAIGLTNETDEKLNNSKIHISYSTFF
ncbi:membrane protein [Neptunitalea chrysea]|uniref:Membrane protein n=2 Tax=Neptunitalea chrysea TaxID=1647581 RepID=A0A9W6B919_9FLAO|nr:membrane protein [Neptunitalea chrysea]